MTAIESTNRLSTLRAIVGCAAALLFVKVLLTILLEYRWYFPADFDSSAFLSGRRHTFFGVYRTAFYAHILSGPIAVVLGVFMMLSGGRARYLHIHRPAGRLLMLIVFALVVPSGFVIARQASAGPIAAYGFATLALATAACAATALYCARAKNFRSHQRWATRCFLLLASPLLLRLISGAVIVLDLDTESFYRLNAWVSWLVPLAVHEIWCRRFEWDATIMKIARRKKETLR